MKWICVAVAASLVWSMSSVGAPTPTDSLKHVGEKWILTSTKPPKECKPTAVVAAGSGDASGSASGGSAGSATKPSKTEYAIALSEKCVTALHLPSASIDTKTGTIIASDTKKQLMSTFTSTGAEIKDRAMPEQGSLLAQSDDGSVVYLVKPEVKAAVNSTVRRCADTDYDRAGAADVEIDYVGNASVRHAPPRNVVAPNEGLVVLVCHDRTKTITVTWAGTRGLSRSELATDDGSNYSLDAGSNTPAEDAPVVTRFTFSPRRAGTADISLFEGTDTSGKPAATVELEVEARYWGAVRFGLGTLFGKWNNYSIVTASGSHTPEVQGSTQPVAFELVSAFAPYVFDELAHDGRSQSGGPNCYVAPFIGFGVVGQNPTGGVQALTSFHFGLELEVASNFSIAATFVYRRTKALAGGYAVGSPVAAGFTTDNVTVDSWDPGFAIVVNASPDFLNFATGGSKTNGGKP